MTKALERVFERAVLLSDKEQDSVAALMLEALDLLCQGREGPLSKPSVVFGSAKGSGWMSDDFDEPLEDFKDYM